MWHFCCWPGKELPTESDVRGPNARVVIFPAGISLDAAETLVKKHAVAIERRNEPWYLGTVLIHDGYAGQPRFLHHVAGPL
ncbi:hypothetical protein [Sulfobacillus harzensis]|uniref:Uncharacterized protein n=1 Tax=Sulfobacillus harzensis TaxID=2729629 RepID=A0A7Y0L233_9FIRM|nr:hypothetical protein [Sulfobacillus harzensis]NMP21876.1 hypothetical protein [Sulfobacillus harzensis]